MLKKKFHLLFRMLLLNISRELIFKEIKRCLDYDKDWKKDQLQSLLDIDHILKGHWDALDYRYKEI